LAGKAAGSPAAVGHIWLAKPKRDHNRKSRATLRAAHHFAIWPAIPFPIFPDAALLAIIKSYYQHKEDKVNSTADYHNKEYLLALPA
jgi:hypothetical protein